MKEARVRAKLATEMHQMNNYDLKMDRTGYCFHIHILLSEAKSDWSPASDVVIIFAFDSASATNWNVPTKGLLIPHIISADRLIKTGIESA